MRKNTGSSSRTGKPPYKKDDARKSYGKKEHGAAKGKSDRPYKRDEQGEKRGDRPNGRDRGERPDNFDSTERFKRTYSSDRPKKDDGEKRESFKKDFGGRGAENKRDKFADRKEGKPRFKREDNEGFEGKSEGARRPYSDRPKRDGDERGEKRFGDRKEGFKKPYSDRPKRDGEDRGEKRFDRKEGGKKPYGTDWPKKDGEERGGRRFEKKEGFKKSYSEDRPKRDGEERGEKRFDRKDGKPGFRGKDGADKKGRFGKDGDDKGFKREGGGGKFGKKTGEKPKFDEIDIFEKKKRFNKKDEENDIKNENEGFSKTLKDKYAPEKATPSRKKSTKKSYDDDFEDDDEDEVVDRSIKKNAARYEELAVDEPMPLNKYIAHSGQCSRRDAADLVKKGKVKVNGEMMLDPGYRVMPEDIVILSGKKLTPLKNNVYILLNKPKGFITTTDDPEGRKTVMELVESSGVERLFPVGRLDRNTTGLLIMTNDGDLAQKLSHPKHEVKKIYQVTLDKALTKADFEKIVAGVELEDGVAPVDSVAYLDNKNEIGLEIHSGRNRIVRRIFESLGYEVEKLDRVMYAGLTKKNIPRGKWRLLTEREIVLLKHFKS